MTREEAIEILKDEAYVLYKDDNPYNRKAFDMAIEALKTQRPKFYISKDVDQEKLAGMIKNFPPIFVAPGTEKIEIIREQKWIPCSERLPEEEGLYPVVINGTEPVLSVEYEQGFAMGYYAPIDEAWEIDGHEELIHDLEVLAWFELPPYEENESWVTEVEEVEK